MTWATSTGSAVVGSLVPTAAEYDSTIIESGVTYGLIKYTFSGSPNLSGVLAGHRLTVAGFTNAENNGTYRVYDANDADDEIRVYNTSRLTNSLDETGITGTGSVADAGAVKTEPSTAKKAQGFLTPEKPSDGMWNWILNDLYTSLSTVETRGAHVDAGPSLIDSSSYAALDGAGVPFGKDFNASDGSYTASANDGAYESVADVNLDPLNAGENKIFHFITGQVDGSNGPFNPRIVIDSDTSPAEHVIETSAQNYADGVTQAKYIFSYCTVSDTEGIGDHDIDVQAVRFTSNAATQLRTVALELHPQDDSGNNLIRSFTSGITEFTQGGAFADMTGFTDTQTFQSGNKVLVVFGNGFRSTSSGTTTFAAYKLLKDGVDEYEFSLNSSAALSINSFSHSTFHSLAMVSDVTGAHTFKMQSKASASGTHYHSADNSGYFGLIELPAEYDGNTLVRYTDETTPGTTFNNTSYTELFTSGSQTCNGYPVLLILSGAIQASFSNEVAFKFLVDGVDEASEYTYSFSSAPLGCFFNLMIWVDPVTAASHTFSVQAKVSSNDVIWRNIQFATLEMPNAALNAGNAPSVTLTDTTGKKIIVDYNGKITAGGSGTVTLQATEDGTGVGTEFAVDVTAGDTPFAFRGVAPAPTAGSTKAYSLQGKIDSGTCVISAGPCVAQELSGSGA